MIIDGKQIAQTILGRLTQQKAPQKTLVAILVGNNPASISFLKQKENFARELGVDFTLHQYPETISEEELRAEILKLANLESVGGILLQLPLPSGIDRQRTLNIIPPEKDVDVLSETAFQAFSVGQSPVLSPAAGVVQEILLTTNYPLSTSKVAVVGASGFLVGAPVSAWLKGKCKDLILLDIGDDLSVLTNFDVVISGVGKAGLITPDMVKQNAVVIDFGYDSSTSLTASNGKGDFSAEGGPASGGDPHISYTPTPGGTGPILVAKLLENFYILNHK